MALKHNHLPLFVSFILILFTALIPNGIVQAQDHATVRLPVLDTFISQVRNGQAGELRGIYIPDILAARIIPQPAGSDDFVSPRQRVVTQFTLASKLGSTGLLAHNNLAGESFSLLTKGQKIYLIYGDGRISAFIVTENLRYQALETSNSLSEFVDLENGIRQSALEVFARVYDRPGNLILQTCISTEGDLSWGRLFVIAEPYNSTEHSAAFTSTRTHRQ